MFLIPGHSSVLRRLDERTVRQRSLQTRLGTNQHSQTSHRQVRASAIVKPVLNDTCIERHRIVKKIEGHRVSESHRQILTLCQ